MSNVLDITSFKQKGVKLHEAIVKEVKPLATSKLLVPIPDVIKMTSEQYDDLNKLSNIQEFYHTEDKMYKTPYNVMEVRVDGRKKLTFLETMELDSKNFEEWEKSEGIVWQ